jgi:hypothetical protein
MIITVYAPGKPEDIEALRRAAEMLEKLAIGLRLGNTADPHGEIDFYVEDDPELDEGALERQFVEEGMTETATVEPERRGVSYGNS